MNPAVKKVVAILSKTPIPLIIIAVFVLGYLFKGVVSSSPPPRQVVQAGQANEAVWTCSMHPQIRLPEPGPCPICGMDLVLAEGTGESKKPDKPKSAPKYACSMFCVDPLPLPGPCPVCGMDMVVVEEEAVDDESEVPTLTLSASARALASIQTAEVERRVVSAEIRMVGKIDYDETRLAYITAWVPGRLDRLYVDYTGVPVKKGEHLVYLYSPELSTAQTELLEALRRSESTSSGKGSILDEGAGQWLEDIRDKFRLWGMTEAQIAAIESRGTVSDYMTIYAPMGGIVIHKNAVEGMYVQVGTRIYTIADLSKLWVKLDAYESDLAWLRYGQQVEFVTEAYPGETFEGTVSFIAPVLDAKTRTVKVRVNVENADGRLKPEMFVRAVAHSEVAAGGRVMDARLTGKWMCSMHPEIVKDDAGDCDRCGMPLVRAESIGPVSAQGDDIEVPLVIPATAPLITGKRAVVYIEVPDKQGKYEGREIRLGPRVGNYYIVLDGLVEGDRVVTNGNFKIDSAMQIRARRSMMNPQDTRAASEAPVGSVTPSSSRANSDDAARMRFDVPSSFASSMDPVLAAYMTIQEALSRDEHQASQRAAMAMTKALAAVDSANLKGAAYTAWMKESRAMAKAADSITDAGDIQTGRASFAQLSELMIGVTKSFGAGQRDVYRYHCPMAFSGRGGDWLQSKEGTANPYFGSTMFRCGKMTETIGRSLGEDHDDGRE